MNNLSKSKELSNTQNHAEDKVKRAYFSNRHRPGLIGGIDTTDRWTTTTQRLQNTYRSYTTFDDNTEIDERNNKNEFKYSSGSSTDFQYASSHGLVDDISIGDLIQQIRKKLVATGAISIVKLGIDLKAEDLDKCGTLSFLKLKKVFDNFPMNLSPADLELLFVSFDIDNIGVFNINEFIQKLTGKFSQSREDIINLIFQNMDVDSNGYISNDIIASAFDAKRHPDVLNFKCSEQEVWEEFLNTFEFGGIIQGNVTREEFLDYYRKVSACIESEQYFHFMMKNIWSSEKNKLSPMKISKSPTDLNNHSNTFDIKTLEKDYNKADEYLEVSNKLNSSYSNSQNRQRTDTSITSTSTSTNTNTGVKFLIEKTKREIKSRGLNAFSSLQNSFHVIDEEHIGRLSRKEFLSIVKELNISLSSSEVRILFDFFDSSKNEYMLINDFLNAIREPLPESRLSVVNIVFNSLDKDRKGLISIKELKSKYNANNHPDVIHGRKTSRQVFNEFSNSIQFGGEVEGYISLREFINYYTNIGACTDNDQSFKLQVKSVWNLV